MRQKCNNKAERPSGCIDASFSDESRDGDVFEVVAKFSEHIDDATAIAVLAWSASRRAGADIDSFLESVRAEAARIFQVRPPEPSKPVGGAPAFDWVAEYGKSKEYLQLLAIVHRRGWDNFAMGKPHMTKSEARRAALIVSAKFNCGRSAYSYDTIAQHGDKLKEALRPSPPCKRRRGKPTP